MNPKPLGEKLSSPGKLVWWPLLAVAVLVLADPQGRSSAFGWLVLVAITVAIGGLVWDRLRRIASRHEKDSSFRRTFNRIEAYSVRPDAAASEHRLERMAQGIREDSQNGPTPGTH